MSKIEQTGGGWAKCVLKKSKEQASSYKTVTRYNVQHDFLGGSDGKASACNAGDLGSIPGSGMSPGEGNGNPFQYSCLENPMDQRGWWATVHGVPKNWTRLSDSTDDHI